MTSPAWIASLQHKVLEANTRTASMFTRLEDVRRSIGVGFERIVDRIGNDAETREKKNSAALMDRVVAAFRNRKFEGLSVREQRLAAKMFEHVPADDMQRFLAAHSSNWPLFAAECLRRWDTFVQVAQRPAYTRLLCLAPESIRFLHVTGRPQEIVDESGVATVAKIVRAGDLTDALQGLEALGFQAFWSFTASVLATWARQRADRGHSFGALWGSVTRDLVVEAMLLPPLRGSRRSWFSPATRPARVRGGIDASARFVSALLCALKPGQPEWTTITESLLASEFGDPRVPPESAGWVRLRGYDEDSYRRLLEQLISEDLTVFFDHAMSDARRKNFWLRYLKSVRRTTCILDRSTHARLTTRLAGADKKLSAAIARSRQFRASGGAQSAQAFCLYFEDIVVVEFSETGNAAHVYDRSVFEKHFQRDLDLGRCPSHSHLKRPNLARERIIHSAQRWEQNTRDMLARLGIFPAPRGA